MNQKILLHHKLGGFLIELRVQIMNQKILLHHKL